MGLSSQHGSWLPPEGGNKRGRGRGCSVLDGLDSDVTYHHLGSILFVPHTIPGTVWKGTTQGHSYQVVDVIGGYLGGFLSHKLKLHTW